MYCFGIVCATLMVKNVAVVRLTGAQLCSLTSFIAAVASAPINLMAVQEGVTNIRVSWNPPTPLGDTTGYRIYYSDSDSSDSVDVSGGSTDNYLLTGLENGNTYTISIVATSNHFYSESVTVNMDVGLGEY